jgi:hypothetical protein
VVARSRQGVTDGRCVVEAESRLCLARRRDMDACVACRRRIVLLRRRNRREDVYDGLTATIKIKTGKQIAMTDVEQRLNRHIIMRTLGRIPTPYRSRLMHLAVS